jgi:glycosyltransferase involved in cell wall biosynthesis
MKVLLVNSSTSMRGGEVQTLALGRGLLGRGVETAFAVRTGSELSGALPEGSVKLESVFETVPFITPLRLKRFVERWQPALIHAQTSRAHTHLIVARVGRVPLIVSRRTAFRGSWNPLRKVKYGSGVSHFIPISEAAAASLRSRGVPDSRMTVVPSGIDIERFASAARDESVRERLRGSHDGLLVGTAAALEKEKGHAVLLRAASILESRGLKLRYLFAGEGRLAARIGNEASALGIDAEIVALQPRMELDSFLKAIDIYVLPSLDEGLSTGLIAAMAAGLPCVASRTGGIPEVTGENSALLVEPANPAALADALERLVGDEALMRVYSSKARERATRFGVGRMVEETLGVYLKVLGVD